MTAEELERVLLHKEGESARDAGFQARSPVSMGGSGKRAIGKAVAKGGLLLKGKNPQNVRTTYICILVRARAESVTRYNAKKTMFDHGCRPPPTHTARMLLIPKQYDRSISISSYLEY